MLLLHEIGRSFLTSLKPSSKVLQIQRSLPRATCWQSRLQPSLPRPMSLQLVQMGLDIADVLLHLGLHLLGGGRGNHVRKLLGCLLLLFFHLPARQGVHTASTAFFSNLLTARRNMEIEDKSIGGTFVSSMLCRSPSPCFKPNLRPKPNNED